MSQLKCTKEELEGIGFVKTVHPATSGPEYPDDFSSEKTTYEIPCLNGCFYYNESDETYRWYQRIDIGETSNFICLNIINYPTLFSMLQVFNVKFNFYII